MGSESREIHPYHEAIRAIEAARNYDEFEEELGSDLDSEFESDLDSEFDSQGDEWGQILSWVLSCLQRVASRVIFRLGNSIGITPCFSLHCIQVRRCISGWERHEVHG
jgi:hypothetical protein